jgi:hypothetical protein
MPIENRDLPVGTRLEANYKKVRYVCTVEAGEDGKLAFVLEDGKRFTSPSSAASAIIKGAANGWRFWSLEGAAPVPKAATATKAPRTRTKADSAEPKPKATRRSRAEKNGPHKIIRPLDNQEDVPEGQVRYWCDACMDAFLGFAGQEPNQCPTGHRIDDPELNGAAVEGEKGAAD